MSFLQTIDNHMVTFQEEEDYLNCRLQYLQYCKNAVMPEVTCIQYIQNGMYPTSIIVQNIVPLIEHFVYGESSFAIGNDSNSSGQDVHIEGNLVVTGEIISGSNIVGVSGGYNADHYASSYYSEPYNETVAAGMSSSEIDEAFGSGLFGIDNAAGSLPIHQQQMMFGGLPPVAVDLSEPIMGVSKEQLIKESSIGPKKDRWEMLDLRGDDNEHD
jgi:hypothetical protein